MTPGQFRALPDDEQRELLDYSAEICPSCGNLRSVCSDPLGVWYLQRTMCWSSATLEVFQRKVRDRFKDAKPDPRGYLPTDGMSLWMSQHDLSPEDDFV